MHNPFVPETLEGWSVLHLMFRVDWGRLGAGVSGRSRSRSADEAAAVLTPRTPADGATALVQLLGHKGDLMVIAFRRSFDDLGRFAARPVARPSSIAFLEPTTSYVSIVELGMYEMTAKIHRQLAEQGLTHGSDAYNAAFDEEMERQRQRVSGRLFPPIPAHPARLLLSDEQAARRNR